MAHIVLPSSGESLDKANSLKFTDVAIARMVNEMQRRGAQIQNIKAKIFGGANMFPEIINASSDMDIGERNIMAVRKELDTHSIEISFEETGGHIGRSVILDTKDGSVVVSSANLNSQEG
ncbi:MAG: chemotaxis protein CheD [Candidatus Neomarinimicrobiota bacterium]